MRMKIILLLISFQCGLIGGFNYAIKIVEVDSGYTSDLVVEENNIVSLEVCNGKVYYAVVKDWRNPTIHRIVEVDPIGGDKRVVVEDYSVSSLKCIDGKLYGLMHRQEIGIASHYKLWVISDKPECISCDLLDRNIYMIGGGYRGGVVVVYPDSGSSKLAIIYKDRVEDLVSGKVYVHQACSNNNLIYYVLSTPTQPYELYRYSGGGVEKITSFNEWVVRETKLYEPIKESVVVENEEIDGWIMLPGEGDKPYPLILYIHGGPKGMYGYMFHPEMQLMVSEGFAVAYANPRGSDGYSEEFVDIRGRYGVDDYKQLIIFLDHVVSKYSIDRDRLGVTGISYGGYLTNVMITKTNRFKAAVSENGIGDWIADYWASDIGYWFDPDQIGGTPHNNLKEYIEKSPVYHVDNVETPVLFIHSMEDYRCFIDQSLAMHVSLVMKNKESRIVIFSKGSHGHSVYAEPRHRKKRYEIKLEWFREKLGKKP